MTNITETCRDLNELTAAAQLACRLLFQECYKAGIVDIFITETFRSQARQDYLWEQGRTRPGSKVTWVTTSNHTSRRAWDIAVAPPKDLYNISTLSKVGAIAKKLGITWGGYWPASNYDAPHFEIQTTWKAPAGFKLEGTVIVPSNSKLKVQLIVNDKGQAVVGVNDGKLYRVQSGTFTTQAQANAAKQALGKYKIANADYVRIAQDGNKWRFITGTYATQAVANNAITEMKRLGILSYAESIQA
ncbi:M15 family metallopeptidase [Lysinibacillus xylanilyticus]|uniref:M15 family metallopeptidase n=1 Tax=Lysinibacillus xylanilyticus TaxID=582475 RepID=UPI002B243E29|nr:M15 family metallopeptidase [Lysinibacillus xylanilyticus]MEB2279654.1 M15 family metallopeptidase [Lysinibacillus xylanilyticus]